MKHRILAATALAALGIAAPAQATNSSPPAATVVVTTDKENCAFRVVVSWTGNAYHPAGVQVNVNGIGRQDTAKQLSDPGGHTLVDIPGTYMYDFVLGKGAAYSIDAWTQKGDLVVREVAQLDCTVPVPPVVVTERVEVPVEVVREVQVAGPERVVTKTVTKKVRVLEKCRRVRATKGPRKGKIVLACPVKKKPAGKKPGTVVKPKFTG